MSEQVLTKEQQLRLFERFRKAAKHIKTQEPTCERDSKIVTNNTWDEISPNHIHASGNTIYDANKDDTHTSIHIELYDGEIGHFSIYKYDDESEIRIPKFGYEPKEGRNIESGTLTTKTAAKMIVDFADVASQISEDFSFERVLEILEGHHLTEQEQKAPAEDRADLLVQRLTLNT